MGGYGTADSDCGQPNTTQTLCESPQVVYGIPAQGVHQPMATMSSVQYPHPPPQAYYPTAVSPYPSAVAVPASGLTVMPMSGEKATWSSGLVPSKHDIRNLIMSAICLPCVVAELQLVTEKWGTPDAPDQAGLERILPLLGCDIIPMATHCIPIPWASLISLLNVRRNMREHYHIDEAVWKTMLASLFLPCSAVQLSKEAFARGQGPTAWVKPSEESMI